MMSATDLFRFDTTDGALAYRDTGGAGRPVVLLHASFLDSSMFDLQLPTLSEHHRVIAPDARGHGASANATKPFRQVDDLVALLRHLGVESVVLAGVSMGAMIAIDTAVEHPELVGGLIVSGRGIGEPEYRDQWAKQVADAQTAALARGDIATWMEAFLSWAAGPDRSLAEVDSAVIGKLRWMAGRTLSKHTAPEPDYSRPVVDLAARAHDIRVPVLAVDGALDSPDVTATVDRLLATVPNGRRVRIEGAGHFPNMEQPAVYNRLVVEFLGATA
ncbi:alpha/beta fold hydrolase [Nocardia sp. NBC_01329]|uniref:alpha/beta fold hydrolase n=1 Tax=Nocardia sp. NBC_01329 TaxID=2903594 RepID=UPI002E157AB3|nr:alpha/beta hydrolase [Nocardia sp. NBC_01329]